MQGTSQVAIVQGKQCSLARRGERDRLHGEERSRLTAVKTLVSHVDHVVAHAEVELLLLDAIDRRLLALERRGGGRRRGLAGRGAQAVDEGALARVGCACRCKTVWSAAYPDP